MQVFRTTRRGLLGYGMGLVGAALLAACGGVASPTAAPAKSESKPAAAAEPTKPTAGGSAPFAKPDTKPAAQAPGKPGQATVSFTSQGNKAELDMFDRIFDSFEKEFPNIKVDRKYDPQLSWPKVINQLRTGTASDVMRTNDDDIFLLLSANVVVSLDDYVKKELKPDDYYAVALKGRTGPGGEVGSALVGTAPTVMFYNVDLLQKAGVTPPTDWSNTWTLDQLSENATKLTQKKGDRTDVYGLYVPYWWPQVQFWNEGVSLYNEDETKAAINTPEALQVLKTYQDWHKSGVHVPPSPNQSADNAQLFNGGLLAIVYEDMNFANSIKKDAVKWDVAACCKGAKHDGAFHNDRNFTVPASTKVRDEAWQLLKYLFTMNADGQAGGQAEIAKMDWGVPVLKKAAEGPLFADPKKAPTNRKIYMQGAERAWPIPDNPMGELFQDLFRRIDAVRAGSQTPEDFLKDADARLNTTIQQLGWSKKNNQRGFRLEGAIEKAGRLDEPTPAPAKPGEAPAKKP